MSRTCQVEPPLGGRGPVPLKMWEVGLGVQVESGSSEDSSSSSSGSMSRGVDSAAAVIAVCPLLVSWMVMVW